MDLVTRMRQCAEDLHCVNPASETVKCLSLGADAINKLQTSVVELERDFAQWKNNHATVVAQARILKERDDMPIERVKAYETWQKATEERDALAAQNQALRKVINDVSVIHRNWIGAYHIIGTIERMAEELEQKK